MCRAIGLPLTLLLAAAACSGGKASDGPESLTTVRVETLAREDIAEILHYVADLEPYAEVKLYSPVPDRIIYFPFKDGDTIRRGQRVALIRKEGIDRGLEQIVAQLEALDVQIQNLEKEVGRSRQLLDKEVISKAMFDQIETQYKASLAQRKALMASKGQLAVTASNAVITAPIDGVIANKMLETGDMAVPQIPLCSVVALDRLKVKLKLIESDVAKVEEGQEVKIFLDAYPDRQFLGKVTNIMPYLDAGTRTNTVEVVLDNPKDDGGNRLLKPGMFGRAELVVAMHEQVLAAPEPALLLDNRILEKQKRGETLRKAFVVDDEGIARERLVRLGARKGSLYEVLEGLSDADKIVVRGQHGLKDGEEVEIVDAEQL
jgi:membrane fusion protein (multidrug efflux system)